MLPRAVATLHREVCPEPLVSPVGKENLGRHPTSPRVVDGFVGAPILISRSGDHREICGLNPWESDCDREEGKDLQHLALESWHTEFLPTESQPAALLTCRTKSRITQTRKRGEVKVGLTGILR